MAGQGACEPARGPGGRPGGWGAGQGSRGPARGPGGQLGGQGDVGCS